MPLLDAPFPDGILLPLAITGHLLRVLEWVGGSLGCLLLLAGLAALWNLHLHRRVRERTAALEYHIGLEDIVTKYSTLFISLAPPDFAHAFDQALDEIGRYTRVDRCYVFLYSADHARLTYAHEWCDDGIAPAINLVGTVPADHFPWTGARHLAGEVVHLPRVSDLPPEARAEKETFLAQGNRSMVSVPMVCGKRVLGFVGFDAVREERAWSEEEIGLLKIMGEIFANALERKAVEEHLLRCARDLRHLAGRLAEAEETERRRIARELHDQVGQSLSSMGINLTLALEEMAAERNGDPAARVEDAIQQTEDVADQLRQLITDLRPAILDDYGLGPALRWYAEQFAGRTGLDIKVDGPQPGPRLPDRVETALFRIAQELLTNAAKHAAASHVTLSFQPGGGQAILRVEDDGAGFDPDALDEAAGASWGLKIITERATAVGGTVDVRSRPGAGATVTVTVPYAANPAPGPAGES